MDRKNYLLDQDLLAQCLKKCDIDPELTIEDLETGLVYFLRDTIKSLRKISQKNQTNEEFIKKKFCQNLDTEAEQAMNNSSMVTLVDPLGDYRFAEKRELEMEKFYEDKIQNNREREDKRIEEENKTTQRYPYEHKKPKIYNEDQEIFKMLSKMKMEKNKDQITEDKIAEGQNITIEMLVKGNDKQIRNNEFQNLRNEIDTTSVVKDQIHITHTNLIQYLENKQMYKKSRYLLKAYLHNQLNFLYMKFLSIKKSNLDSAVIKKKTLSPFGGYISIVQSIDKFPRQFCQIQQIYYCNFDIEEQLQYLQKLYKNCCDFVVKPTDHSLYCSIKKQSKVFLLQLFYSTEYKSLNEIQKFISRQKMFQPDNILNMLMCLLFAFMSLGKQNFLFDRRCVYFNDEKYLLKPFFISTQNQKEILVKFITTHKVQLLSPEILLFTLNKVNQMDFQSHNVFALGLFIVEFGLQKKLNNLVKDQKINKNFLDKILSDFQNKFKNCQLLSVLVQNMLVSKNKQRKSYQQLFEIVKNYQKSCNQNFQIQETPSFLNFQKIDKKVHQNEAMNLKEEKHYIFKSINLNN